MERGWPILGWFPSPAASSMPPCPDPHQLARLHDDIVVKEGDLLAVPAGSRTEAGLRWNIRVGVQYLEAWLRGVGCVPLYDLMEDAATAEISRTQIWQWLRHGAALDDGRSVDACARPRVFWIPKWTRCGPRSEPAVSTAADFKDAIALFERLVFSPEFEEFLTVPAYELLSD